VDVARLEAKLSWVRSEGDRIQREAEQKLQALFGAAQMLEELIEEEKAPPAARQPKAAKGRQPRAKGR